MAEDPTAEADSSAPADAPPPANSKAEPAPAEGSAFNFWTVMPVVVGIGAVVVLPLFFIFSGGTSEPWHPVYTSSYLKHQIQQRPARFLLLILGRIYDVTKGKQFYAKGEEYHGYCKGVPYARIPLGGL